MRITYVADMAGEYLACEFEVALLLSGEDALLLVEPARELLGHAVAEVLSHGNGGVGGVWYDRGGREAEAEAEAKGEKQGDGGNSKQVVVCLRDGDEGRCGARLHTHGAVQYLQRTGAGGGGAGERAGREGGRLAVGMWCESQGVTESGRVLE